MSWKNIVKNVGEHGVGDMEQYERRMLREEGQETDPERTKLAEKIHDDYEFVSYKLDSIMDYVQWMLNQDNYGTTITDLEHILELATKKK